MKKGLMLFALALASSAAAACPAKPGYAANGLVRLPTVVKITCKGSLYEEFKSMTPSAKWLEVLYVPLSKQGANGLATVLQNIQANGYKEIYKKKTDKALIYQYQKGNKIIVSMTGQDAAAMYMILSGK